MGLLVETNRSRISPGTLVQIIGVQFPQLLPASLPCRGLMLHAGCAPTEAEHGVLWRRRHCRPALPPCHCQQVRPACSDSPYMRYLTIKMLTFVLIGASLVISQVGARPYSMLPTHTCMVGVLPQYMGTALHTCFVSKSISVRQSLQKA